VSIRQCQIYSVATLEAEPESVGSEEAIRKNEVSIRESSGCGVEAVRPLEK
jgi:hypothetical protein